MSWKRVVASIADFRQLLQRREIQHTVESRFWSKVEKTRTCWFWIGSKNKVGYGRLLVGGTAGRIFLAHRLVYELWFGVGSIPNGYLVLHRCDTPSCVNPNHLAIGTQRQNIDDRVRHGNNRNGWSR